MSILLPVPFAAAAQEVTVRILAAQDANAFRAIRLEALKHEGELFGPTYETESKQTLQQWQDRCTETPEKAVFGLFHGSNLIGVMQARRFDEDATGKTALWGVSYVLPQYRYQGLAKELYKTREEWTKRHPAYERAVLFIREDNKHSRKIHIKNGAKYMFTRQMSWPGRPASNWEWYEVHLSKVS